MSDTIESTLASLGQDPKQPFRSSDPDIVIEGLKRLSIACLAAWRALGDEDNIALIPSNSA